MLDVGEKTKAEPKKTKGPFWKQGLGTSRRVKRHAQRLLVRMLQTPSKLCKKLSIKLGACFGMVGWSKYNNGI